MPVSMDHLRAAMYAAAKPDHEGFLAANVFNHIDDMIFKNPTLAADITRRYNEMEGKPLPLKSEATSTPSPGLPQA